jgi:uncharacterized membrane protein YphA (DoxX/SURF4 family)
MSAVVQGLPAPLSGKWVWTGRILSGFIAAFLVFDGGIKVLEIQPVVDTFQQMGYPVKHAALIGIIELLCVILYVIPRTAVLGAVLLTAVLGGAIATHVRIDSPLFSHTLFGVYLGLIMWGGLYLREPRVRALLPLSS